MEVKSKEKIYVFENEFIQFSEVSRKVFLELWNEEVAEFINSEKYKIKSGKSGIDKIRILKKLDSEEKKVLKKFFEKYKKMFSKNI